MEIDIELGTDSRLTVLIEMEGGMLGQGEHAAVYMPLLLARTATSFASVSMMPTIWTMPRSVPPSVHMKLLM